MVDAAAATDVARTRYSTGSAARRRAAKKGKEPYYRRAAVKGCRGFVHRPDEFTDCTVPGRPGGRLSSQTQQREKRWHMRTSGADAHRGRARMFANDTSVKTTQKKRRRNK